MKSTDCGNAKETGNKQEIYGSEIGYKATKLQATIAERAKMRTIPQKKRNGRTLYCRLTISDFELKIIDFHQF